MNPAGSIIIPAPTVVPTMNKTIKVFADDERVKKLRKLSLFIPPVTLAKTYLLP